MNIKIGISNRHVHLSKEDIETLFGKNYKLTKKRDLSQSNNYVCFETVNLINNDKIIKNVKVVGPERDYSQVEVSLIDAKELGINPPYANSGDLINACKIKVEGTNGNLEKNICIMENRHIHMTEEFSKRNNFKNNDIVKVKLKNDKILDNVHIKVTSGDFVELHIDMYDKEKYNIENGDIGQIIL